MRQYTIRGMPEEIEKKILEEADKKGLSINKALISLLESSLARSGARQKKRSLPKGLEQLFGVWEKKESDRFDKSLKLQREIDEGLWSDTR